MMYKGVAVHDGARSWLKVGSLKDQHVREQSSRHDRRRRIDILETSLLSNIHHRQVGVFGQVFSFQEQFDAGRIDLEFKTQLRQCTFS